MEGDLAKCYIQLIRETPNRMCFEWRMCTMHDGARRVAASAIKVLFRYRCSSAGMVVVNAATFFLYKALLFPQAVLKKWIQTLFSGLPVLSAQRHGLKQSSAHFICSP